MQAAKRERNGRNPHTSAPGHQLLEGRDKSGKGGNAFTDGVLRIAGPARARVGADSETLQLCRDALESSGFVADAVDSGIAAVVAARASPPDLVLVDVQLRDVPGCEAIGWLRSNPSLQSTPIIVLTTNAEDDVVSDFARTYASLPKPVSPAAIRRTIREVLEEVSPNR